MNPKNLRWNGMAAFGIVVLAMGCTPKQHSKSNFLYMPDMFYSPAYKAQEEGSMRLPVRGTIPRGIVPYPYEANQAELAEQRLVNPVGRTMQVLRHGQALFNVYCIVCHGRYGEGDGPVVPPFPKPTSLQSQAVGNYKDGRFFHIITRGKGNMPGYFAQLEPSERWAIVHYLRALYRAKHPQPEDMKAFEATQ